MKLLLLFIAALVPCLPGYCQSSDFSLVGEWHSNKESSVATLHYKAAIPDELRKRMEDIFGQLKLTYTEKEIVGYAPRLGKDGAEWSFRTPYRVVAKDDKGLVYIFTNLLTNKEEICHIHFDGPDRYWVYVEDRGWKEFFDRSKK